MVRKPKKISTLDYQKINQTLLKQDELCVGNYLLKGYRIQISKYLQTGSERVMSVFRKRRSLGLCIVCAKPVKRMNRFSGKLYRLCDEHRKTIDNYKGK